MPVYDDQRQKADPNNPGSRPLTGISKAEEGAADQAAGANSGGTTGRSLDPSQLQSAENGQATTPRDGGFFNPGRDKKKGSKTKAENTAEEGIGSAGAIGKVTNKVKGSGWLSRHKGILLIGGGGGGLILAGGALVLLIFLSSLKSVHFGQILATAGFARFQVSLRERAAQNMFDAAVVDGGGSLPLDDRSLFDRLRRINPEKQLAILGNEDKLKLDIEGNRDWLFRKTNEFKGLTVTDSDGVSHTVNLDTIAQEHGASSWADMNSGVNRVTKIRERMAVRADFVDQTKFAVEDTLAIDQRYVRNSVYDGIRQASDIKMSFFRNKAREFIGKNPQDAYKTVQEESYSDTYQGGVSGLDSATQDAVDQTKANIQQSIETGAEGDIVNAAVKKASDISVGSKITSSVSTAVLVSTLSCMVNQAASKIQDATAINQDNAKRLGDQALTVGDQIKRGDAVGEAVSADSHRWDGADQSPAYQADAYGRTDAPTPDSYRVPSVTPSISPTIIAAAKAGTSPSSIASGGGLQNNQVDQAYCEALLSPGGQAVVATVELVGQAALAVFSGGAGNVAEEAGAQATARLFATELLKGLGQGLADTFTVKGAAQFAGFGLVQAGLQASVQLLGGVSYSGTETGANLYGSSRVGVDLLQQENERKGLYGRPLTDQEVAVVDSSARDAITQKTQSRAWTERYFATDNPYSLVSMAAASSPTSLSSAASMFGNWFGSIGSSLNPFNIFGRNFAHAAAPIDHHGVAQWGYSADEMDKINNDDSYTLQNNEIWINQHGGIDKLAADLNIDQCFTAAKTDEVPKDLDCSADKLKTEAALRYRIYKGLDTYTVGMLAQDLTPQAPTSSNSSSSSDGTLGWPMAPQGTITQCFTWNGSSGHPGVDIAGTDGTPIFAIADGVVDNVKAVDGYGTHFVSIKHDNGFGSSYGHMSSATVSVGQTVKKGDQIGTQGNEDQRGVSSGSHLHLNLFHGAYSGSDASNIDPLANGLTVPAGVNNSLHNCQ